MVSPPDDTHPSSQSSRKSDASPPDSSTSESELTLAESDTNAEDSPWSVLTVATKISGWIDRLGSVWATGQIAELKARPGTRVAFLTLRDTAHDASLQILCPTHLIRESTRISEGSQVLIHAKPKYYIARGSLSLWADHIRVVGVGELLARIEKLRQQFAHEGLSDPRRKRPLPFLPQGIGLITGRASAAQHDVVSIAQARWSHVHIELKEVAVQGPGSAQAVIGALQELHAQPHIDVIILARGGGSIEDLLTFSEESLCRAIAACPVPVVSAIGHETDHPLSDDIADLRAATPTDAAKRVVPDVTVERDRLHELQARNAAALRSWVDRERAQIHALAARPVLTNPLTLVKGLQDDLMVHSTQLHRGITAQIEHERLTISAAAAQLAALGPAATLARGYALVHDSQGNIVRASDDTQPGDRLRIRLAHGMIGAMTTKEIP